MIIDDKKSTCPLYNLTCFLTKNGEVIMQEMNVSGHKIPINDLRVRTITNV